MDILELLNAGAAFLETHAFLTLVVAGFFVAIIATVIGGAMFFALPIFQFLFPSVSAGVLVGNIKVGSLIRGFGALGSTWKLIEFRRTLSLSLVAFLGTILGASIIADLDQRWLFVITLVSVLVAEAAPHLSKYVSKRTFAAASFLIGVYTGFLGAGTGILLVALLRTQYASDEKIAAVNANARFAETFLGISAVAVHLLHGNLIAALWIPWSIGAFVGGYAGGHMLSYMSALPGSVQKIVLRVGFALAIGISALAFVR